MCDPALRLRLNEYTNSIPTYTTDELLNRYFIKRVPTLPGLNLIQMF
jgi:hypothetical protein